MESREHTGLKVEFIPSPNVLTLEEAKKLAGLSDTAPVEVLGTFPNAATGQRGEGFTRLTALNTVTKWSNEAYFWCVGMVGFAPSSTQHASFLTHSVTHGDAAKNEHYLLKYYHEVMLAMLEAAEHPTECDAVVFGGTRGTAGEHYSERFRNRLAEVIHRESGIRPIIIPSSAEDTIGSPKPKRVLVDTERGRLFFFEPGLKKKTRTRAFRLGDSD